LSLSFDSILQKYEAASNAKSTAKTNKKRRASFGVRCFIENEDTCLQRLR
jgi:hypothetical protein